MLSPAGHSFDYAKATASQREKCPSSLSASEDAREGIRKRTFTRWINMHLKRCDPPMQVDDLLTDIRDGKILMALLEELSGCKMLYRFRPSTNYIFSLNNIVKALDFLEDRNVKVVNVEAADIADGRSSVVLGLIWNIIVSFQLKEVTGNLEKRFSSLSSLASLPKSDSSACSSPAPPSVEQSDTHLSKSGGLSSQPKYRSKAITALLNWANMSTSLYGVEVCDFSESWRDGLAFLALVKCAKPELVDMNAALSTSPRQNLTDVFTLAEQSLGIPALLQKEDMMVCSPDEQSVITYVAQFLKYFQDKDVDLSNVSQEHTFNSTSNRRICALASPSLDSLKEDQGCSSDWQRECSALPQNMDMSASHHCLRSSALCSDILPREEKFIFSNGLCCSTEGLCWSSLSESKSHSVCMEKDDECSSYVSEESVLLTLDSDEEDAYSYILELEHHESELHDESSLQLRLCAVVNAQKAHHNLHEVSILDVYQGERKWHYLSPSVEIAVQSLQSLSEDIQNPEKHTPEAKLLYTESIPTCHKNMGLATDPPTFSQNDNKFPELNTYEVDLHNSFETVRTLNKGCSPETEGRLHNKASGDYMDTESVSVKKRSYSENAIRQEENLSEVKFIMQSNLEDGDYTELGSCTHQSNFIITVKEPKIADTSKTAKDVKPDVISAETEVLHKVLLLWILTYCIFMLHQPEFWALFS